jgi:dGTPase
MDLADDIAYSVHDMEDGVVGGWFTLNPTDLDLAGIVDAASDWYDTSIDTSRISAALDRLESMPEWPRRTLDATRESRAVLKSLTSALIGRFVTTARDATVAEWGSGPLVRYQAQLVVPQHTLDEITALKAIAAHYIMRSADLAAELADQRDTVSALVRVLVASDGQELDPELRRDFDAASDDATRLRVVIDQVASLTDISAAAWAARLL